MRQGLNGIATTLLNIQASVYGDAAIAAFSIVTRVSGLLFSMALGIGQGFQPVSAFNFGARKYSRVRKAFAFTVCSAMGVLALLCLVCQANAEAVIMLFRKDTDVVQIGAQTLRFACFGLITLPLSAIGSMLFQSIGKKGRAMILALMQSGGIFIPLLLLLPRLFGLTGLELAHPVAYAVAGLLSIPFVLAFLASLKGKDGEEL